MGKTKYREIFTDSLTIGDSEFVFKIRAFEDIFSIFKPFLLKKCIQNWSNKKKKYHSTS